MPMPIMERHLAESELNTSEHSRLAAYLGGGGLQTPPPSQSPWTQKGSEKMLIRGARCTHVHLRSGKK